MFPNDNQSAHSAQPSTCICRCEFPSVNLDLDKVEEALEADPGIRGIMFAHVLGNPPDMDRLMALVEKYDLVFLEDACDALGSFYDGKKLGSYGDMSTCSFSLLTT